MIISIFIPHGGCPERCTFCDQKTSGGTPTPLRSVELTIQEQLKTAKVKPEIAFYGGTFTALSHEAQRRYLEVAKKYISLGLIESVRLSTRPDAIDESWLKTLKDEYHVRVIELGVQSHLESELRWLGRSHSTESAIRAVETCRRVGISVGTHFITGLPQGLPHENPLDDHNSQMVEWITTKLRPDFIRIHPLLVIEETELAQRYARGEFTLPTLDQAVEQAAFIVAAVEQKGIPVVRIGLQPNEVLGSRIVAGAYHPAFGELVRSRMLRSRLTEALKEPFSEDPLTHRYQIEFLVPKILESQLRGQKNENLTWLKQRFALGRVGVSVVNDTPHYDTKIEVRLSNSAGASQCRQINLTQRPRWRGPRHCHA